MYRIFSFIILLVVFLGISLNGQNWIISSYDINDPHEGQRLFVHNKQISSYIKDSSKIDYSCKMAFDGKEKTAWCVKGYKNQWMKLFIEESQYVQYQGMMNVYRIIISNGLTHNKKLYYMNNRIKKIRVDFSEGQTNFLKFKDGVFHPHVFRVNIKAKWIKLTILEVYKGSKFNDTCINEMWLETAKHPSEMTDIEKKNLGYE